MYESNQAAQYSHQRSAIVYIPPLPISIRDFPSLLHYKNNQLKGHHDYFNHSPICF